jgi:hypothetical protein
MADLARSRSVYTPQFLRNGRDWRSAGSPLDGVGDPAAAAIVLELGAANGGQLAVERHDSHRGPGGTEAWLALYENNLESRCLPAKTAARSCATTTWCAA